MRKNAFKLDSRRVQREAEALMKLATSSRDREEVIAMLWWEAARFLYFTGKLPEFWRLTAEKKRPDTSISINDADLVIGNAEFPKSWGDVSQGQKVKLIRICIGNQSSGAQILDAREGWQFARWFAKWHEEDVKKWNEEKGVVAPTHYPLDGGGMVVLLRLDSRCGWNNIALSVKKELKKLGLSQYGRSNKSDVKTHETKIKGLAGLWMRAAGSGMTSINKLVFPSQAKKGDQRLLNNAISEADSFASEMLEALNKRCKPWTDHIAWLKRTDAESRRQLRNAIALDRKERESRAANPVSNPLL